MDQQGQANFGGQMNPSLGNNAGFDSFGNPGMGGVVNGGAPNFAGQNVVGQSMAGRSMVGQRMVGQSVTRQNVVNQGVVEQNIIGQGFAGQNMAGQGFAGQNAVGQNMVGQGFAGQGFTEQMPVSGNDEVVFTSAGSPEKGGKKKLILGIVLGLVVVGGIAAGVFFGMNGGFGGSDGGAFSRLKDFIENGDAETRALFDEDEDEEEDIDGESKYIMAIRISEQGEAEVRNYYQKLAKLEQEFYGASAGKIDADLMEEYGNALKVLRNAVDYYDAEEELVSAYEHGGESGSEEYFRESISCNSETGDLLSICSLEEKYYKAGLTVHRVYVEASCYENGEYDYTCVKDYYGIVEYEIRIAENGYASEYMSELEDRYGVLSTNILQYNTKIIGEK